MTKRLPWGQAVSGLNAYSKGVRLGLFQPTPKEVKAQRQKMRTLEAFTVDLLQRAVPAIRTEEGLRAVSKDRPINPDSVRRYLESKFGVMLDDAYHAMSTLAKSMTSTELAGKAYHLYEQFRPEIPPGRKGWGAAGKLSLDKIRELSGLLMEEDDEPD